MKRKIIALSIDSYDCRIHEGALRYIRSSGAPLELIRSDPMLWEKRFGIIRQFQGAIVLARAQEHLRPLRHALKTISYPVVLLQSDESLTAGARVVECDYAAGQLAARYFMQRGFCRFAVACQGVDAGYRARLQGFEEKLAAHGHTVHRMVYRDHLRNRVPGKPFLGWHDYLHENIRKAGVPLAIFVLHDREGSSVLRHCEDAQIRVPEEVAVLGVGNDHIVCDYSTPPLSSIDMNRERIGWEAAKCLHALLEGEHVQATQLTIEPYGVVERRSTEILSAEDPRAMRALRFLMDHLQESMTTADIARSIGLSSTQLNRVFMKCFGRTVKDEQCRLRMQRAGELLRTTSDSGKQIADATGFQTLAQLCKAFQQVHGMTMTQFRANLDIDEATPWGSPVQFRDPLLYFSP